ncbi:MAG: TIGR03885 family FMN-dependent LLM class oxidoreductase [Anaerolineae bacterium]|nr:TIGR03885 family FMN-dependent LLM class oxidoreductase [Anaerolineae bacterium]
MVAIGYHCSHERFKPSELLQLLQLAERAGFHAGMCSDHFHPWSEVQGQSGFTWSWLGAALQATSLSLGMVCAPGQRYHPAIIAQAAATLGEMFPGRLWCAFGTGQNLNEHITGDHWLPKPQRRARLEEAVAIIRALWAGETVTHRGYITVEEAKLYTRPDQRPLILGAALSNETAEWVGKWADGLITAAKPPDEQRKFIESFWRGGGDGKPIYLQALHGYADDLEAAKQESWQNWRTNSFGSEIQADLKMPQHFETVSRFVRPEDMTGTVRLSSSLNQHIEWLQQDIELGFERIFIHNAANNQRKFIEDFGAKVLPQLA